MLEDYDLYRLKEIFGPIDLLRYESGMFFDNNSKLAYDEIKRKINKYGYQFSTELSKIFIDCSEISLVQNADFHFGGKCVVKLRQHGQTFFYKPKYFEVEHSIKEIFESIFNLIENQLFILPKLIQSNHSFYQEELSFYDNDNISEWLYNLGMGLVILKLLGVCDLHEDNIAVSSNKLVLIDFETTFNYNIWRGNILELYDENNSMALSSFDLLNTLLFDPFENDINIERLTQTYYQNNEFDISDTCNSDLVVKGMNDCIVVLKSKKTEIINLLKTNSNLKFRLLLRPTVFYHYLIKKYFSYDYLKLNFQERKAKILRILDNENKINNNITLSEFNSIKNGDIPVFYGDLIGNIYNSELENIYTISFQITPTVDELFRELNHLETEYQWIIRRLKTKEFEKFLKHTVNDHNFIYGSIVNLRDSVDSFKLEVMGIDIYDGIPGFLLAFAKKKEFEKICQTYINMLFRNLNTLNKIANGGAYTGLGSLLLFLLIIRKILSSNRFDHAIEIVYNQIETNYAKSKKRLDLLSGDVGLIIILAYHNSIFQNSKSSILNTFIIDLNLNQKSYSDISNIGLAHGKAGLLFSYSLLKKLDYPINVEIIQKLQADFINLYSFNRKNWISSDAESQNNHSWCNGGAGILIAIEESQAVYYNVQLLEILKDYKTNNLNGNTYLDHLCCGSSVFSILKNEGTKYKKTNLCIPLESKSNIQNISFFFGRSGLKYYSEKNIFDPCLLTLSNII